MIGRKTPDLVENITLQGQIKFILDLNTTEITDNRSGFLQESGCADCIYSPTGLSIWQWCEHRRDSRRQPELESKDLHL